MRTHCSSNALHSGAGACTLILLVAIVCEQISRLVLKLGSPPDGKAALPDY